MQDAITFLRVENLFVDSFDIIDVKRTLIGDHLSRAVGRVVGSNGRTKAAIENATITRIVVTHRYLLPYMLTLDKYILWVHMQILK